MTFDEKSLSISETLEVSGLLTKNALGCRDKSTGVDFKINLIWGVVRAAAGANTVKKIGVRWLAPDPSIIKFSAGYNQGKYK